MKNSQNQVDQIGASLTTAKAKDLFDKGKLDEFLCVECGVHEASKIDGIDEGRNWVKSGQRRFPISKVIFIVNIQ